MILGPEEQHLSHRLPHQPPINPHIIDNYQEDFPPLVQPSKKARLNKPETSVFPAAEAIIDQRNKATKATVETANAPGVKVTVEARSIPIATAVANKNPPPDVPFKPDPTPQTILGGNIAEQNATTDLSKKVAVDVKVTAPQNAANVAAAPAPTTDLSKKVAKSDATMSPNAITTMAPHNIDESDKIPAPDTDTGTKLNTAPDNDEDVLQPDGRPRNNFSELRSALITRLNVGQGINYDANIESIVLNDKIITDDPGLPTRSNTPPPPPSARSPPVPVLHCHGGPRGSSNDGKIPNHDTNYITYSLMLIPNDVLISFLKQVLHSTGGKFQDAVSVSGIQMGEVTLSLPADFNAIKPPQLDISLRMNLIFRKNSVSVHIQNKVCPKALSACFVNMEIKKCNILPLISFNILTKKLNKKIAKSVKTN